MSIQRAAGEGFAWRMGELYADAEIELWQAIARRSRVSRRELDKLRLLAELREEAGRVLTETERLMVAQAQAIVAEAYERGAQTAITDIPGITTTIVKTGAVQALADALTGNLAASHVPILRHVEDIYRAVTTEAASLVTAGTHTRREATQVALDRFAARGIRGFTDRAGRRWGIDTYAEMTTRTIAGRTSIAAGLDQYTNAGIDLVIVSDAPRECPMCTPWERQVLSVAAARTGTHAVRDLVDGMPVTFTVRGTVEQAMAAGLLHPNCRHTLNPYVPGVTATATEKAPETSPELYRAGQQQRYLERRIREWKRRAAVGNPNAGRRVRAYQARLRAHLEDFPELKRLYYRETTPTGKPGRATR